ncbi:MAG: peptidylprolyl isomerase [Candidatus Limnocylindrales bacterium]
MLSITPRIARTILGGLAVTLLIGACAAATPSGPGSASSAPRTPPASSSASLAAATAEDGTTAVLKPPTATPLASAPAQTSGDGTTVTLHTQQGNIVITLFTDSAPVAAQNFENLVRAGFYNGTVFHRIIPGFVIQGGDPTGTGMGGPGYTFPDEPFAGSYTPGTVAMANAGPNTNGSQFFIVVGDQAASLPHAYTIFGTVTSGLAVAQQIAAGPRGGPNNDQALQPVKILTATVHPPGAPPAPASLGPGASGR